MKKTITIALAGILCAVNLASAEEPAPIPSMENPAQPAQQLGKEAIAAIRKAYEKGEYDAFLKEMEESYQKARLSNLAEFRKGPADEKWIDLEKAIRTERNQELLSLVSKDNSPFAQKVRSVATELSPNVEEAFSKLASFRYIAPGSGANADENALIDLDLAYEYKAIHLDLPKGEPLSDARAKHYVLKMEKMDKMVQAAKNFQDPSLKEAISLAAENFDARLAQNWDLTDLNALAKGRIQPSSELEEKVANVFNSTQDKFAELSKQLIEQQ